MRHLHLNIVPIIVPNTEMLVGVLPFDDKDGLRELRSKYVRTHVFKRAREKDAEVIYSVALDGKECAFAKDHRIMRADENFGIVRNLVEEYLVRSFSGKRELLGYSPLEVLAREGDKDQDYLMRAAQGLSGPSWLCARLSHQIEARRFCFEKQAPFLGLVLNQRTYKRISRSCAELIGDGVDIVGLYVVSRVPRNDDRFAPQLRLVGRVEEIKGTVLHLSDYRDAQSTIEAKDAFPEANPGGFFRCLRNAFGAKAESIDDRLYDIQSATRGGASTLGEIARVGEKLASKPMELLPNLNVTLGSHLNDRKGTFPFVKQCSPALLVFDPTLAKPATSNKLQLLTSGPYSQRGFSPSKPRICVVCQRGRKGEVEQWACLEKVDTI